jgi:hypothetical protein
MFHNFVTFKCSVKTSLTKDMVTLNKKEQNRLIDTVKPGAARILSLSLRG